MLFFVPNSIGLQVGDFALVKDGDADAGHLCGPHKATDGGVDFRRGDGAAVEALNGKLLGSELQT